MDPSATSVVESLRSHLVSGNVIRNAWLTIGSPGLAETVASSPFIDAVTIDLQHGDIAAGGLPDLVRAIELGGAGAMARLGGPDPVVIGRLLDLGFEGLIMPTVSMTQAAVDFVESTRYPPRGPRSFGPIRHADRKTEDEPLLWAMIETREGLETADEIASVDGIDGLFVGPGDLGLSLGIGLGQNRTEPEFLEAIERVRQAAEKSGVHMGIHATKPEYSQEMFEAGFHLVTVWVDAVAVSNSLQSLESE